MEATIEFSPGIPIPAAPFDVQERIKQLRGYLDSNNPDHQPEQQHTNIKAAIKLYEESKIDGVEQIFIKDGKVVTKKEAFAGGSWVWNEGIWHQYAQKHAYGHGPFGVNFHEVSIGLFSNARSLNFFLQIRMLLRLMPQFGGDGTVHGIIAMNDTGSDALTLFDTDLPLLGNIQAYPLHLVQAWQNLPSRVTTPKV
jgi:hypothetical protein